MMIYREIGKTGVKVSSLGFGMMRLPLIDGKDNQIDYDKAKEMVEYAIEMGVNYIDTAWPYHGGTSEDLCKEILAVPRKEPLYIATKSPVWDVHCRSDFDDFLDKQLEKLGVDQIDFYMLHAMSQKFYANVKSGDYQAFLDDAKASGKIKFAGFSYHDDFTLFKELIDSYDWDFCQIQLNYMDEDYQAGLKGALYAKSKGIGVIVMEPLRGGTLCKPELPKDLQAIWDSAEIKRTPAEWALKYLWNKQEVDLVLSGMSTLEHVKENVTVAKESPIQCLTDDENNLLNQAKVFFNNRLAVNCTSCGYCMPCPSGVNIPENFWALNHDKLFDDRGKAEFWINGWLDEPARASACTACGKCQSHCPQNIPIIETLKHITQEYITS